MSSAPASPTKPATHHTHLIALGGFVCNTLQHQVTFYNDKGERTPDLDIPICESGYYLKLATADTPPTRDDPEFNRYTGIWHRPFTRLVAFNPTTQHVLDVDSRGTFCHIFGPLNCSDDLLFLTPKLFIVSLPVFQWLNSSESPVAQQLRRDDTVHIASPDTDLGAVRNDKGSVIGTKRLVFYV